MERIPIFKGEGLDYSRWAPRARFNNVARSTTQSVDGPPRSPEERLQRIRRLLDRLAWKGDLLLISRTRALASRTDASEHGDMGRGLAMFKLDHFEFYGLLERILVLLLALTGISVSRGLEASTYSTNKPEVGGRWGHRYHADVLEAFQKPDNILKPILGEGVIYEYLTITKEYRNRWKDADEAPDGTLIWEEEKVMLGDGLETMLRTILEGISNAIDALQTSFEGGVANRQAFQGSFVNMEAEETPWEVVEDAMDWE